MRGEILARDEGKHEEDKYGKGWCKGRLLSIAAFIAKILSAVYRVPFKTYGGQHRFCVYQQVYLSMESAWCLPLTDSRYSCPM